MKKLSFIFLLILALVCIAPMAFAATFQVQTQERQTPRQKIGAQKQQPPVQQPQVETQQPPIQQAQPQKPQPPVSQVQTQSPAPQPQVQKPQPPVPQAQSAQSKGQTQGHIIFCEGTKPLGTIEDRSYEAIKPSTSFKGSGRISVLVVLDKTVGETFDGAGPVYKGTYEVDRPDKKRTTGAFSLGSKGFGNKLNPKYGPNWKSFDFQIAPVISYAKGTYKTIVQTGVYTVRVKSESGRVIATGKVTFTD